MPAEDRKTERFDISNSISLCAIGFGRPPTTWSRLASCRQFRYA